jgi:hypothetical protein
MEFYVKSSYDILKLEVLLLSYHSKQLIGHKKKRNRKSTEIIKKEIISINEFIFISFT